MKFQVTEIHGRPFAKFEPNSLLSFFLEDARGSIEDLLDEIEKAKLNEKAPTGFTGDHVDISFYPDRAVIEDLWPEDEDNPSQVILSLDEAKQLLLDWQIALANWRKDLS